MCKNLPAAIIAAALVLFGSGDCLAATGVTWTQTFGTPEDEFGVSCKTTMDGGYVIAGDMQCQEGLCDDIILVKADDQGTQEWIRSYGGDWQESASSVISVMADGGFLIGGSTESFGAGCADIYLIRTNEIGDTLWTRTYGGGGNDWCSSVRPTHDGGFVVAGVCGPGRGDYDIWLLRTDEFGNEIWGRLFGGSEDEWAYDVRQTDDDGYIIAGTTRSFGAGSGDVYLVRLDRSANLLWEATFGGFEDDCAYSVACTMDGGYIVAGYTESFGAGSRDAYLIKVDQFGFQDWDNWFGGDDEDVAYTVKPAIETDGYILAGRTASFGEGDNDLYVIKTYYDGSEEWSLTCGGGGYDCGMALQKSGTSGYVVAGATESEGAGKHDVYLVKIDSETALQLEAIPYQTIVPSAGTLDFAVEYMNPTQGLEMAEVLFELFMPGEADPTWAQGNEGFQFPPGTSKKNYTFDIPYWPPHGDGYKFKAAVLIDGERVSESAIDFEIVPAMISVP